MVNADQFSMMNLPDVAMSMIWAANLVLWMLAQG